MAELTPKERKLCELLINSAQQRQSASACWARVFPEDMERITRGSRMVAVSRFKKRPEVIAYMQELQEAANEDAVMNIADVTRLVADRAVDPITKLSDLPFGEIERVNEKTGEILGYDIAPLVCGMEEIPTDLKPLISGLIWEPGAGKFRVVPRDDVDSKTRAKYVDMLMKRLGGYAPERLEVTGANGGPVASITSDMDAVTAAELYRKAVKGK